MTQILARIMVFVRTDLIGMNVTVSLVMKDCLVKEVSVVTVGYEHRYRQYLLHYAFW